MTAQTVFDDRAVDAALAGICGAYCGACPVYLAWARQDHVALEALARALNAPVDRLMCTGCRTPAAFCFGGECEVKACAKHRGVAFCTDCADYPCNRIRRSQVGETYRSELSRDVRRLREAGVTVWLREQDARWRCAACGSRIAAGADTCPRCHARMPSA